MATLKDLTERSRSATEFDPEVGTTIKLDLKGEGFVHICGSTVTNDDAPADLVVTVALKDLRALGKGELDPTRAIMSGRLKLSDMGLAMQLRPRIQSLFSGAA